MLPVQELTEHLDKERGVSAQGPARPPHFRGLALRCATACVRWRQLCKG